MRFALTKFRPTTLPATLLTRSALLGRLEDGAAKRLTVVVGSAGAGKSVLLHERSEGWVAALQMAALTMRGARNPAQVAAALDVSGHAIAEYFIGEVMEQQPPEVARFMLDASVLDELTAEACAVVTGLPDAAALLRSIEAANLFVVALDDDRTIFRYHHRVHRVLRATDPAREVALQLRAAEWLEAKADTRQAARHFLAARQAERALALLQDRVITDFLHDPVVPAALDLSTVDPSLLAGAPDRLLALVADLLLWGHWARGGEYLDLLERTQPEMPPDSKMAARLAALRAGRHALIGEMDEAVREGLAARSIEQRALIRDEWNAMVPVSLLRAYTWLEDFEAVDHEVTEALSIPSLTEPFKLVLVRGAQALAWFGAGRIAQAAAAARAAAADASRLGFDQHPFAVDYTRALAGDVLERRDFDAAEQLTERALSISEHYRPNFEYLALLGPGRDLGRPGAAPSGAGHGAGGAHRAGRNDAFAPDPGRRTGGAAAPGARRPAQAGRAGQRPARDPARPAAGPGRARRERPARRPRTPGRPAS